MFGGAVLNLLLEFRESCSCSPCFSNVRVVTALTWDLVYTVSFYSDVLTRPRSCVVCVCLLPIHSFIVPSSFHTVSVSRKDRELSLSSSHVNFMLHIVYIYTSARVDMQLDFCSLSFSKEHPNGQTRRTSPSSRLRLRVAARNCKAPQRSARGQVLAEMSG